MVDIIMMLGWQVHVGVIKLSEEETNAYYMIDLLKENDKDQSDAEEEEESEETEAEEDEEEEAEAEEEEEDEEEEEAREDEEDSVQEKDAGEAWDSSSLFQIVSKIAKQQAVMKKEQEKIKKEMQENHEIVTTKLDGIIKVMKIVYGKGGVDLQNNSVNRTVTNESNPEEVRVFVKFKLLVNLWTKYLKNDVSYQDDEERSQGYEGQGTETHAEEEGNEVAVQVKKSKFNIEIS